MSEFEFLSVLISIIFGLALTQVMAGTVKSLYAGEFSENLIIYSSFTIVMLVLNWWVSFSWIHNSQWKFGTFLMLVLWAMSFYGMAATIYPPATTKAWTFERRRRYFLWAFAITALLDILTTGIRGSLFTPWYYLPFVGQYIVLACIGAYLDTNKLHRLISWWLLVTVLIWSLVVRESLSELV